MEAIAEKAAATVQSEPSSTEIAKEGGGDAAIIQKLNSQNERLRATLKEINEALAEAIAQKRAQNRPAEARISGSVQDLDNTYKRIGIYKKANDVLRDQISNSYNPERMIELRNELAAAKIAQRKTMEENTTLRTQIRRLAKEFQNSEREAYEQKVAALTAELNAYKEKLALYVSRHNTEEKAAIQQQQLMTNLELKSRKLQEELNGLKNKDKPLAPPIDNKPKAEASSEKAEKEAIIKRLSDQQKKLELENNTAQTDARTAKKRLLDAGKELATLRKQLEEKNAELKVAQDLFAQVQKDAREATAKSRLQGTNLAALPERVATSVRTTD